MGSLNDFISQETSVNRRRYVATYEGYAPDGAAVLVEAATDNTNRTVANVRNIFTKLGGNLGTTGCVEFMFRRMGVFRLKPEGIDQDELELDLIDHGLYEMGEGNGENGETQIVVRCAFEEFGNLQKALEERRTRHSARFGRAGVCLHKSRGSAGRSGHLGHWQTNASR